MIDTFTGRKRIRKNFGRLGETVEMPNLIEVQKTSYEGFLQRNVAPVDRLDAGLQEVYRSVFPIQDFSERGTLEYVDYAFEEPKYDVEACQQRGMAYAAPLKVTLRLVGWDIDGNWKHLDDSEGLLPEPGELKALLSQMEALLDLLNGVKKKPAPVFAD